MNKESIPKHENENQDTDDTNNDEKEAEDVHLCQKRGVSVKACLHAHCDTRAHGNCGIDDSDTLEEHIMEDMNTNKETLKECCYCAHCLFWN
jgi:hypothetical protein